MITQRQLFLQYLAQTSNAPIQLEITHSEGIYLHDIDGREYIDLISGISVSNIGHRHKKVIQAIQSQIDKYLYLMVYGEYIQSPQVLLAKMISDLLPSNLNNVYFVNSGSEAIDAAIKLAKRYTGRSEVISFNNAYHGNTIGALSIMGNQEYKRSFRPLMPETTLLNFNDFDDLNKISNKTACVVIEPIQGEAGIILPEKDFLKQLRKKCSQHNTLLVFDEIQTGYGRTGKLFAFEQYDVIPDVITIAKGIAGGMPLGALISSKTIMDSFKTNPMLGHITTFGGHPVSCAAGIATLNVIKEENLLDTVENKFNLFKNLLQHDIIKSIRGKGLFIAIELRNKNYLHKIIQYCIDNGVIVDWFLFNDSCIRISPPLIINEKQINKACKVILDAFNSVQKS